MLGIALAGPRAARAVIGLDADFDHGSLDEALSSVSGSIVTLTGRDNFNPGTWKWLYFSATGVAGLRPTFRIDDDFATGGADLVGHKMVYSYDRANWSFFDNNIRSAAADTFSFSNNSPFVQDQVYVAYGYPHPYQRTVDNVAALGGNQWVTPTTTGDSNFVIGQSPGGVDDLGRTVTPKNLYGFKITDSGYTGPKKKVVALGGVHANETLGNYTLDGLVDFLLGDEAAAVRLRRYAEFYLYPLANPDGRFAGYNRSTVERPTVDPNRAFNPPSYRDPDNVTQGLNDIREVGETMRADTGGDIDYLIDFHSTVNQDVPYHHGLVLPQWQSDPFWLALRGLEPQVITAGAALTDFTGAKFGRDELDAEFSATFETVFSVNESLARYANLGRNFGLAWDSVFSLAADLNFDGVLDVNDWSRFIAGSETDLAGLPEIEQYERGDLDGDGVNSVLDFGLFKGAFEEANGLGSFAAMLAGVPEPSGMALSVLAAIGLAAARRRIWRVTIVR